MTESSSFGFTDISNPGGAGGSHKGGTKGDKDQYQLESFPTVSLGGWNHYYNWFGGDKVKIIGKFSKGNKSDPGDGNAKLFEDIPDKDWHPDNKRPTYQIGIQDNNHGSKNKDIFVVTGMTKEDLGKNATEHSKISQTPAQISWLFEEGGDHRRGFISDWQGFYNTSNWYQNTAWEVLNTNGAAYPFACKGISFCLRVPRESSSRDGWGNSQQWADHNFVNYMHGLWVDKDGKHHSFEMLPNGDNHGKARVSNLRNPLWTGDPDIQNYYFVRHRGTDTTFYKKKKHPNIKEAMKLRVFTMRPEVEHMWFKGFAISIHTDQVADVQRSHTFQYSNLSPIPFYSPRKPMPFKQQLVLGAPTPLSELKKGLHRIAKSGPKTDPEGFNTSDTNYHPDQIVPGHGRGADFDKPDGWDEEKAPDEEGNVEET